MRKKVDGGLGASKRKEAELLFAAVGADSRNKPEEKEKIDPAGILLGITSLIAVISCITTLSLTGNPFKERTSTENEVVLIQTVRDIKIIPYPQENPQEMHGIQKEFKIGFLGQGINPPPGWSVIKEDFNNAELQKGKTAVKFLGASSEAFYQTKT